MDRRRGWDDSSDRRAPRGGPRDSDRPPRDRDADRGDRRDNHRRDDRDDRNRRYRSRSRDRRDRPRDDRDRDGHRSGRPQGRDRDGDRRRDHEERPPRRRDDDEKPPRRRDEDEETYRPRDKDRRRSASPRQGTTSPPPARRPESRHADALPTRGKVGDRGRKEQHTMSFNVGGRGGARDSPLADSGRSSEQPEADAGTRMDQDEREEGEEEEEDLEVEGDDAMAAMMGFGGFGTTKNKKIAGNNVGGVRKEKKSEYRQYMNRQGGFNRPLSPGR